MQDLVIPAFRYALGRMTYIVSVVQEEILKYKTELRLADINLMIREIDRAINEYKAGMTCDVESWLNFKRELQKEIEQRHD